MTSIPIEQLLEEDESSTLDFKRDQYELQHPSDWVKAKLLKDILAFANTSRDRDAYIVIGVDEVTGGRRPPVGVSRHLPEADLQLFVNLKTQRPVEFAYRTITFDGKDLGVIVIPVQQRPLFLTKDFGPLKRNEVYIRRGSATDIADPDEITKMAAPVVEARPDRLLPRLIVNHQVYNGYTGEVLISVANAPDSAVARQLYLQLSLPLAFHLTNLPGRNIERLVDGSAPSVINLRAVRGEAINPGTSLEVARVQWAGSQGQMPKAVLIGYVVGAEGTPLDRGSLQVTFRH